MCDCVCDTSSHTSQLVNLFLITSLLIWKATDFKQIAPCGGAEGGLFLSLNHLELVHTFDSTFDSVFACTEKCPKVSWSHSISIILTCLFCPTLY